MKMPNKQNTKEPKINWPKVWSIFDAVEKAQSLCPTDGEYEIFGYEWNREIYDGDLVLNWNKSGNYGDDTYPLTFTPVALSAAKIKGNVFTALGIWDENGGSKTEPVSIELRNYAPYKIKNVVKTDKDKQRFKTLWERRLKDAAVAQAELEEYEA